ncbi:MAG: hypothetical protein DRN27_08370, partial [Thermoplasmata archaeon]
MNFKKYDSIENTYRQKYIDYIINYELTEGEWVVSEKVHGSNFAIYYNGTTIKAAKRTAFINDGANFFGSDIIVEEFTPIIKKMYDYIISNNIEQKNKGDFDMIVHGEIFGGYYAHPDVQKTNAKKVQKGISYSPNNEFYPFDIQVDNSYISYDHFEEMCKQCKVRTYAKSLFRGTFQECLDFPNAFNSTIPAMIGNLPEIKENTCEGVVIKPCIAKYYQTGSRIILKNKNAKWSEDNASIKVERKKIALSDEAQKIFN